MMHSMDFGDDFTWGVAASACQTEGAYLYDNKQLSIWDVFTSSRKLSNPHTACDFYSRYIQDIILMQYMNIKNFRFSLAWSRMMTEDFKVNEKGVSFYDGIIDFCLESGIQPWITLYHWDLPDSLEAKGGWANRDTVYRFCDYVSLCINKFGDRVKHWMVLNEPFVFTGAGYFMGIHAPGKKGLSNYLPAVHHAVLAQAMGAAVIRSINSSLCIGTTFSYTPIDSVDSTRHSFEAAQRVDVLTNRLFIEPLLGLGYPWKDLRILNQLDKYMVDGDEKSMAFDMDFIGLQNYTREVVKYSTVMPYLNARIVKAIKRDVPVTEMGWEIYPEGMYRMLKRIDSYENVKKIIITENGAAFPDVVVNGHVHDTNRINFFHQYLEQVQKAKNEGVKVDGYFAWSFTDNFEWAEGYSKRFGLVYVDYETQKRIIKDSGLWFKSFLEPSQIIHARAV